MKRRAVVAIAVVTAWLAGMAALARRELSRSDAARLAESALRVAPGAIYFAVYRAGAHVGFASTTVDTVPGGFHVADYSVMDVAAAGGRGRATSESLVRLSRRLTLRSFRLREASDGAGPARNVSGRVVSDTLLEIVVRADGVAPDTSTSVLHDAVVAQPFLWTAAMLAGRPRIGRRSRLATLDLATGARRERRVRLAAESLFVVPDSAVLPTPLGPWRVAHNDSVLAWRLAGVPGTVWVDRLGRAVRVERPDGITLQRTAYELAFENWRAASPQSRLAQLRERRP
ncbi:MAG: hypothetical protein ACT4R6_02205 [Gemmatimonadaceae bacterium]